MAWESFSQKEFGEYVEKFLAVMVFLALVILRPLQESPRLTTPELMYRLVIHTDNIKKA